MKIQCTGGSRSFAKYISLEDESWSMVAGHQKLTTTSWEPSLKLILLCLEKLLKNSKLTILWSFGFWSKLESWKSSISRHPMDWWKKKLSFYVRKHLTRGFLCAVLDLSGTLWPLLIPEYSGIKRRGTPFPGLRNPGILIKVISTLFLLMNHTVKGELSLIGIALCFVKSGILIFIFAENNYFVRQYMCPCHVD